jgi:hypothetical protein
MEDRTRGSRAGGATGVCVRLGGRGLMGDVLLLLLPLIFSSSRMPTEEGSGGGHDRPVESPMWNASLRHDITGRREPLLVRISLKVPVSGFGLPKMAAQTHHFDPAPNGRGRQGATPESITKSAQSGTAKDPQHLTDKSPREVDEQQYHVARGLKRTLNFYLKVTSSCFSRDITFPSPSILPSCLACRSPSVTESYSTSTSDCAVRWEQTSRLLLWLYTFSF